MKYIYILIKHQKYTQEQRCENLSLVSEMSTKILECSTPKVAKKVLRMRFHDITWLKVGNEHRSCNLGGFYYSIISTKIGGK